MIKTQDSNHSYIIIVTRAKSFDDYIVGQCGIILSRLITYIYGTIILNNSQNYLMMQLITNKKCTLGSLRIYYLDNSELYIYSETKILINNIKHMKFT